MNLDGGGNSGLCCRNIMLLKIEPKLSSLKRKGLLIFKKKPTHDFFLKTSFMVLGQFYGSLWRASRPEDPRK